MADPKQPADLTLWEELARKDRKGADPSGLVWHTPEGIDVKPLYTAADVADPDFTDTTPGVYPFLRGPRDQVRRPAVDHPPVRRLLDRRGVERLL